MLINFNDRNESKALNENLKLQMSLCLHSPFTLPVTASVATLSLLGISDYVGVVKYLSIVISVFNTVGGPLFTSSSCSQSNNLYDEMSSLPGYKEQQLISTVQTP